eukprot:GFYU01000513.1.p1 GENE.GFYU01000513.1~~GFYU01000513.1.p1  ORF type:complete len:238 (+),score=46.56 GFYU01000513.1:69-782(+)
MSRYNHPNNNILTQPLSDEAMALLKELEATASDLNSGGDRRSDGAVTVPTIDIGGGGGNNSPRSESVGNHDVVMDSPSFGGSGGGTPMDMTPRKPNPKFDATSIQMLHLLSQNLALWTGSYPEGTALVSHFRRALGTETPDIATAGRPDNDFDVHMDDWDKCSVDLEPIQLVRSPLCPESRELLQILREQYTYWLAESTGRCEILKDNSGWIHESTSHNKVLTQEGNLVAELAFRNK